MVERQLTHNNHWRAPEVSCSANAPWPTCIQTPRNIPDFGTYWMKVLVALHATRCHRLCQRVCRLSKKQSEQPVKKSCPKPYICKTRCAPIQNSSTNPRTKHHKSPLHQLMQTYDVKPQKTETISPAPQNPALTHKRPFTISISDNKDNSVQEDTRATETVKEIGRASCRERV